LIWEDIITKKQNRKQVSADDDKVNLYRKSAVQDNEMGVLIANQ